MKHKRSGASDQKQAGRIYFSIKLKEYSTLMKSRTQWKLLSNGQVKKEYSVEKTGEMLGLILWMSLCMLMQSIEVVDKLYLQLEDAITLVN